MAYFLAVAGLLAYKDASLFAAFSCPWTPSTTFYKLREIEREAFAKLALTAHEWPR